jgi:hypothetical protein
MTSNIIFFFFMATTMALASDVSEEQTVVTCNTADYLALETAGQKLLWATEIMEIILALVSTMLLVSILKIRKLKKKLKKYD